MTDKSGKWSRWRKHQRMARLVAEKVNAIGDVRGYHGGCPTTPRPFFGSYELCLDDDGHICCYACGAHGLGETA
jgi:hypothetical protein